MSSIREITVYDLKKKIDNKDKFLLIDVRENQELAISKLTEKGWLLPYSTRADSLINFTYTRAAGDDLLVSDLVPEITQ